MADMVIVVSFEDEKAACEAVNAIKQRLRNGAGGVKLNAGVMLLKREDGSVSAVEDKQRVFLGVPAGTLAGALVGLVGGPIGAAVGAGVGAVGGLAADTARAELDEDFISSVVQGMEPGTVTLVAEASEEDLLELDAIAAQYNGRISRQRAP